MYKTIAILTYVDILFFFTNCHIYFELQIKIVSILFIKIGLNNFQLNSLSNNLGVDFIPKLVKESELRILESHIY